MGLKTQISDEIKVAMKAQDKDRLQVLRMLLSELKYAQAQKGNVHEDLPLAEEERVVGSYYKKLDKSLADYPAGEARAKIEAEMVIVASLLPKRAGEDDVRKVVKQVMEQSPERQFGPLMKLVMAQLGSAADGKVISAVLKEVLGSK